VAQVVEVTQGLDPDCLDAAALAHGPILRVTAVVAPPPGSAVDAVVDVERVRLPIVGKAACRGGT
jgi:hypothetical protein